MKIKKKSKILVIGCGGTGSEVIKLLKFKNYEISCLDYDKVEISNLIRQFYYIKNDINKYKSKVLNKKLGINFYIGKIQKYDLNFINKFNVIFCCVDNINTRMDINLIFKSSKCDVLFDLGVEGNKLHVKKVNHHSSCLYCIKDLYNTEKNLNLCSLINLKENITEENREKYLNSFVLKNKENNLNIAEIVLKFNNLVKKNLKTTDFEVKGIFYNLIPNSCFINSICASLAIKMFEDQNLNDFLFYNSEKNIYIKELQIKKCENCLVCNNFNLNKLN